ncbi:Panacea domain-containing protein [Pseudofrankia sp. BMG5.37]|uniref:Panacea domain-containing protein n=1 Tax=Pseudofrankia sp. BMG5.37 TaxID=3050035 RepID=UPI002895F49D|nr:Panacea domain-containing protein [Pseudofrankia sp. BMG5.37]MDT3441475.1 Panacea domain-containing protein [Pseudofrankia sp. BMG5.37]
MMSHDEARAVAEQLSAGDLTTLPPDAEKLGELIVLVAGKLADDRFGGATKLNKVLYYAEFAHVRETGMPITGEPYRRLPNGPAPRNLKDVRGRLVREGAVQLVEEPVLGYTMHRLKALRAPRLELFTESELRVVDDAVALLSAHTSASASDYSHDEPGWQMVGPGEDIPFASAYLPRATGQVSRTAARRGREIAEQYVREGRLAR